MVTLAQRIQELRTESGLSRAELSAALGFSKGAFEKFETGRQTPTKEQQEKIAGYFGVSLFYLRGESRDRTRQEDWMNGTAPAEDAIRPRPAPQVGTATQGGGVLDSVLAGKQVRELLRSVVLETLRSKEGQAILKSLIQKELADAARTAKD